MLLKILQYSQENTSVAVSVLETPAQVLSCEICEIVKNTYFEEHLRTAASENLMEHDILNFCIQQSFLLYKYMLI